MGPTTGRPLLGREARASQCQASQAKCWRPAEGDDRMALGTSAQLQKEGCDGRAKGTETEICYTERKAEGSLVRKL